MKILKMKELVEGFDPQSTVNASSLTPQEKALEETWTNEEKKTALEEIGRYNEYGKSLYREGGNLMELAHTLSKIAENAQRFVNKQLDEKEEGWFDKVMVERNMKELSKCNEEFRKYAQEAHVLEQRMQALYEEMGTKLNRYFEIKDLNESSAPAIPKIK
jgi:DNA repair ATPase RecN